MSIELFFLCICVLWLFLFRWYLCRLYYFLSLESVSLRTSFSSFLVIVRMHRRYHGILASPLSTSFLDTYSLSTSYLECKALHIVMSFLVLWFICCNFLFHFKNCPSKIRRKTQMSCEFFIPALVGGIWFRSKCKNEISGPQDTSQYPSRS